MNKYIGHSLQISGVEEYRLVGGKGDGMRIYHASNGLGMEMDISPDRAGDITRLRFKGVNMGYMSPCGYVAPAYYDKQGSNWLQSFTAGFLTTCGLQAVGTPCVDEGEELPYMALLQIYHANIVTGKKMKRLSEFTVPHEYGLSALRRG